MRVLIDTTYARRARISGTAVYIRRVCEELSRMDGIDLVEVANDRRRPPAGGGIGSVRNLLGDLGWTAVGLPRLAGRAAVELIHHPLPAISPWSRMPQVVTVVDLAFERLPDQFDRGYRSFAHLSHRAAARGARAVICISETTARDVRELWGVPSDRIVVAPLGPGQDLAAPAEPARGEPAHFLYVGDDEPRKNLATLLAAYRIYRSRVSAPLELVLAGSVPVVAVPGVRTVARPDGGRLAELYAGAAALVHPSLYEGFGMTTLEAMTMRTPVLAARSPGVVEVCADAACYAEALDAGAFAARMVELAESPSLRADLVERGSHRAEQFSWSRCARAHLDAYSLAVS